MSFLYQSAIADFENGDIDWERDDFFVMLASKQYKPNPKHRFLSDTKGGRVGSPCRLTGRKIIDGCATANDSLFKSVRAGKTVTSLVIYKAPDECGNDAKLVACIDRLTGLTPLELFTNDGDIVVNWNQGKHKIFAIPNPKPT